MTSVQVRKAGHYVYDVFIGTGFDNWSRVRKHHWGVSVVAGNRIPRRMASAISDIIVDHPDGSVSGFDVNE